MRRKLGMDTFKRISSIVGTALFLVLFIMTINAQALSPVDQLVLKSFRENGYITKEMVVQAQQKVEADNRTADDKDSSRGYSSPGKKESDPRTRTRTCPY